MKILLLSWRGPAHPNAGGAEISTHEHAKGWVKKGNEVTLFTSYYQGAKRYEVIDGVEVVRKGRQIFGVQLEAFFWYLFGKHEAFDIIIDQFHGIPFFTPLYIRKKKLAFIHEVTKEVWHLNPWSWPLNLIPSIFGRYFEPLIFKLFYGTTPFMTVSKSTKQDLIDWGIPEKNIYIVHNGISLYKLNKIPKKESRKTAIYLGSLSKDKGVEDSLKILSKIKEIESNWQFWVVGTSDKQYLIKLKKLTKELGLQNNVKFYGYVSEKIKFELLSRAHVLVNPSTREGWGLVIIEAASVGTPAVGYDVPGLRDSIINGKTGVLCKIDISDFSKAILSLMANKNLYIKMSSEGKKWAKTFDWHKSSKESLELINKIANDKV